MPDVSQVVIGSAKLFIAAEAIAIPTFSGAETDFAAFTAVGYTNDGIECDHGATFHEVHADEESDPIDVSIDKETHGVSVKMIESGLQNLYYAMAGATFNGSDEITFGGKAKPDLFRIGVIGPSPAANKTRELIIYRAYPKSALKLHYKRNMELIYQVQFVALSDSTQPAKARTGMYKDF